MILNPHLLAALLLVIVVGLIGNLCGIRFAQHLGIFSMPSARRRHGRPVPVTGGLWAVLAVLSGSALLQWSHSLWTRGSGLPVVAGLVAMTLLGHLDDRKSLQVKQKFFLQALICGLLFALPQVREFATAYRATFGLLIYPILMTFFLGILNAINFIDGLDGLAATNLILMLGALSLRAFAGGGADGTALMILLALPALATFLLFNWRPAKIFMGDSGSLAFGFLMIAATFSISPQTHWQGSWREATAGVIQLGYPILDLLWVISKRLRRGFSPFRADQSHLHHHLLRLGFSVPGCVLFLGLFNLCLQVLAWQAFTLSTPLWPVVLVATTITFLLLYWILTTDQARNSRLAQSFATQLSSLTESRLSALPSDDFSLLIDVRPLIEGQANESEDALEVLIGLLCIHSPRGTRVARLGNGTQLGLVFPNNSVAIQDAHGLVARFQRLIENWVELFNVSLSGSSLRVSIGNYGPLRFQRQQQSPLRALPDRAA